MGSAIQVEFLMAGFTDTSGDPLSGGKVYTYGAGTDINKTTWTDADKVTPAPNPIILDAYGRALIFADGDYKFIIKDAADDILYTWDDLEFLVAGVLSVVILGEVAAPTAIADKGQLTCFDDGGDTELRYTDHAGNDIQLTRDGKINAMGSIGISVDEEVVRWDGVSGGVLQGSKMSISDAGIATLDGVLKLTEQTTPASSATHGYFYSKDVGGVLEAHYEDSDGNETQLTNEGAINIVPVSLGAWVARAWETVYEAATDGFIIAYLVCTSTAGAYRTFQILTDNADPPTTERARAGLYAIIASVPFICCPIRKGDFYKIHYLGDASDVSVKFAFWIPLS